MLSRVDILLFSEGISTMITEEKSLAAFQKGKYYRIVLVDPEYDPNTDRGLPDPRYLDCSVAHGLGSTGDKSVFRGSDAHFIACLAVSPVAIGSGR
jgi:hypothetical protein